MNGINEKILNNKNIINNKIHIYLIIYLINKEKIIYIKLVKIEIMNLSI